MTNTLLQLSALIEAFLFAKGSPVSLTDMAKAVGEDSQMIEKALTLLSEKDVQKMLNCETNFASLLQTLKKHSS